MATTKNSVTVEPSNGGVFVKAYFGVKKNCERVEVYMDRQDALALATGNKDIMAQFVEALAKAVEKRNAELDKAAAA